MQQLFSVEFLFLSNLVNKARIKARRRKKKERKLLSGPCLGCWDEIFFFFISLNRESKLDAARAKTGFEDFL